MSRRALVLFTVMCVIWGIPYLLIKVAVSGMTPASLVFLRTGIGAVLLVPVAVARGEVRPVLRAWRWVVVYTVAELAVPWFLLSSAETRLTSSLSGLLVAAVPLIGALLAWITRSEHQLDGRRLAGLGVGLAGVGVLLGFDISVRDLGAVAEVGLCTVGYAIGPMIISRKLSRLPSVGVVAASLAFAALVYAPLGIAQLAGGHPTPRSLASAATLGVVCTAVAFVLFFALIAEIGPVRATVITYLNPAVALVLGVSILGEPLRIGAVLGFALILAGSFLATRRRREVGTAGVAAPTTGEAARAGAVEIEAADLR
ncbi:MAG: DMT family transporter [Candidatus Dormibacteria bacterium]|jgi:drug/metabolite transporter (DMT)-like permease